MAGPANKKPKMTWARLANDPSISANELPRIAAAFGLSKPKAKPTAKAAKASKAGMKKAFDKPRTKVTATAKKKKAVSAAADPSPKANVKSKAKAKTTTARKPKTTTTTRYKVKGEKQRKPASTRGEQGLRTALGAKKRTGRQPGERVVWGGGSAADVGTRQPKKGESRGKKYGREVIKRMGRMRGW